MSGKIQDPKGWGQRTGASIEGNSAKSSVNDDGDTGLQKALCNSGRNRLPLLLSLFKGLKGSESESWLRLPMRNDAISEYTARSPKNEASV